MVSMLLAVVLHGEAAAPPWGEPVACTVVKTRPMERREGPSPATPEDEKVTIPPSGASGTLHFLTLRCGKKSYLVRVVGKADVGNEVESLAGPLRARFEGEKVFLRHGQETETEGVWVDASHVPKREGAVPEKPQAPEK